MTKTFVVLSLVLTISSGALAQGNGSNLYPETNKTKKKEAKEFGGTHGNKTYAFCIRRGLAQGYKMPALGQWCTMHGYNN